MMRSYLEVVEVLKVLSKVMKELVDVNEQKLTAVIITVKLHRLSFN